MVRALGLISGGLDSTLACLVMKELGVEVIGIHFSTGFCLTDVRRAVRRKRDEHKDLSNPALKAGAFVDIPVHIIDISEEYFQEVLLKPKHGFGAYMNPCVDCRIFMFRKAKELLKEFQAQFIFTGEVLDQRPMSQHLRALQLIEKEAGLEGLVLRPLSAKRLPETIPEKKGWVRRDKLLSIQGRSRKIQMELAKKFQLVDYPQPAGGCCTLVEPEFAHRLKDYLMHRKVYSLDMKDILLLKVGRHFRLNKNVKLIVGREEAENNFLELYFKETHTTLKVLDVPGPVALLDGDACDDETLMLASRIVARYADADKDHPVRVLLKVPQNKERVMKALPLADEELEPYRIHA